MKENTSSAVGLDSGFCYKSIDNKYLAFGLIDFEYLTFPLRIFLNIYASDSPSIYEYLMSENDEPLNGNYPVSNAYRITPKAHISEGLPR